MIKDKILELMKEQSRIRNIAVCAHVNHGKTSFSDNLISGAGFLSEELVAKALVLDFRKDEIERGITIDSADFSMVHKYQDKEFFINLIDTPGHVDFCGEVSRSMRAADGAVVVVCAVEGMMPQTETVLRQALKEGVKPVLFINKVDRLIKELKMSPESMQKRFSDIISGVNDIIHEFTDKLELSAEKGDVMFGSAKDCWAVTSSIAKCSKLTFKDIIRIYHSKGERSLASKVPLYSAAVDVIINHLPDPASAQSYRIPLIWKGKLGSSQGKSLLKCSSRGKLFFECVKLEMKDDKDVCVGRIFSGSVKKGQAVFLNSLKKKSVIEDVYLCLGKKKVEIGSASAGNIVAVRCHGAVAGETITLSEELPFEELKHIFEPVITKAVEPKNPKDLPKLVDALKQISKEDPSINVSVDKDTGEHLISGMGELHLEIVENRIKTEKGVEIKTSPPVITYRETVKDDVSKDFADGKKFMSISVARLGKDVLDALKDIPEKRIGKKDKDLIKFVSAHLEDAGDICDIYRSNILLNSSGIDLCQAFEDIVDGGVLVRESFFGLCISVKEFRCPKTSSYSFFADCVKKLLGYASVIILEPVQLLLVDSPVEFTGEISGLISNREGDILDIKEEFGRMIVHARIPVEKIIGWISDLRGVSLGRASSSLVDQSFEPVPDEVQDAVIVKIKQRKGII